MSEGLPELYARARELDESGRAALLREVSERDPGLGEELAAVLADGDDATSPLDRAPWRPGSAEPDLDPPLPERIGAYRILGELGRGGMGRVLLAEEETEAFRRNVALKIVSRPEDDEALRRFRDEVRILSSLEHPGIARFLSGGRTPEGTWFLALEPVVGEEILAWAARHDLAVRARVELFRRVLEPVAYAHRRGVVHRDLKPSHLLIDETGAPRLLDFGISKLVDPESRTSVTATATVARALTPAYASPEQFRGLAVTPASDVYALGVILYELLTGSRPFDGGTDSPGEIERAALESDPHPPSTAARRFRGAGDSRPTRRAPPRDGISRDLDAICLKSIRKEPHERYADAGELAADLDRFLLDQPVLARRGGLRYRAGRLLRRHRAALAGAGGAILVVAAVLVAIRAEREASSLRPAPPPAPAPFPFHAAERTGIAELEAKFARSPADVQAGSALAIGLAANGREPEARLLVARLRQIPGHAEDPLVDYVDATLAMTAGEPQRALVLFTRARDNALSEKRGDLVGQIRASRGRLLSTMGEREEAAAEMQAARVEMERVGDDESLWRVLNDLAIERLQAGDLEKGSRLLAEAVAASERAGVFAHVARTNLALVAVQKGRPDLAEAELSACVDWLRERGDARRLGEALQFLAEAVLELGRPAEAGRLLVESIALLEASGAESLLVNAYVLQGEIAWAAGRLAELEAIVARLDTVALRIGDRRGSSYADFFRGRLAAARGDLAAARERFDVARRLLVDNGDVDQAAAQDLAQARLEFDASDLDAATRLLDGAFARLDPGAAALGSAFSAEMLRARIDLRRGDAGAASGRIARFEPDTASSPSVTRRVDFLVARAELGIAAGRAIEARVDHEAALAAATSSGRLLDALAIRIALARLDPDPERSRATLATLAAEARELGLAALPGLAPVASASPGPAIREGATPPAQQPGSPGEVPLHRQGSPLSKPSE